MLIEVKGLAIGYNREMIATGIDISLPPGESLLVIGHNGSGKSTFLRTLFGLLEPLAGAGEILGFDIGRLKPRELLMSGARYLGQGDRCFDNVLISDYSTILSKLYGFERTLDEPFSFPKGTRKAGELSIGQRKLAAINLFSAGNPKLILMDEPTAGMDSAHFDTLIRWMELKRETGMSFILVEQKFRRFLPFFESTLVFRGGEISFCGPSGSLLSEQKLASVFL